MRNTHIVFASHYTVSVRYKLIAIDLDGTLLNRRGRISDENLAAIVRAQEAGITVVPCTGRAWRESREVLESLPLTGPGVFVTGAVVGDIATGNLRDVAVIEPNLAHELVRFLEDQPEAVLVCREHQLCGHDYLVTGRGELTPNTQWWFERTGVTVHFQESVVADDLHHTLRVGVVADGRRMMALTNQLREAFYERILVHSFEAVKIPTLPEGIHVLEAFAAGVDKWRGLQLIADDLGVATENIAGIGDGINDVAMLRAAGCGIAMENATEEAKLASNYVTRDCDQHGVAYALDRLLTGRL